MKLYWHKWVHRRGTVYLLLARPQVHGISVRETGEEAIVQRINGRWHASWKDAEGRGGWSIFGAPGPCRRWIEKQLDLRSLALYGVDDVEFVQPTT